MLFIYTEHITPRLQYTCDFIFNRVISTPYEFVSDQIVFENIRGAKLNYSTKDISSSFHLIPSGLLFETGIREQNNISTGTQRKFRLFANSQCDMLFDVFAAVFYMISRYEEYLIYKSDQHERFEASQSILYKHDCLDIPVVDIWCFELKQKLQLAFPELKFGKREFKYISTIDVDNNYAYLGKSIYRFFGASVKDILKRNVKQFRQRKNVILRKEKDPFDAYAEQIELSRKSGNTLIYFFLTVAKQTDRDRSLLSSHPLFGKMIDVIRGQAIAGIHPSYYSESQHQLSSEKEKLKTILGFDVVKSRQHYLRFNIRTTPQWLIEHEIKEDYTMGFASHYGFRAGTCTPFQYYDLEKEEVTTLEMFPFAFMDSVFYDYLKMSPVESEILMKAIIREVKEVQGVLISVWHDRSFSEFHFPGWKVLYASLQTSLGKKNIN